MGDGEDDLASLLEVLRHVWTGIPDTPAAGLAAPKCPSCSLAGPHLVDVAAMPCPGCREPIYPTDVLHLHQLVGHARQLASLGLLPPGTLVSLPDGYLRPSVVPGPASAYGKDTDFGRRFVYSTGDGRVHVLAVPCLSGGQ